MPAGTDDTGLPETGPDEAGPLDTGASVADVTRATLVETLVKTHLVSGRRLALSRNKSQLGAFQVYAKRRAGCKGGCPNWLSFHRGYTGTVGFHQIPVTRRGAYQSDSELGQPRSHGCVRQSKADSIWLHTWAVLGDVVVVVP